MKFAKFIEIFPFQRRIPNLKKKIWFLKKKEKHLTKEKEIGKIQQEEFTKTKTNCRNAQDRAVW